MSQILACTISNIVKSEHTIDSRHPPPSTPESSQISHDVPSHLRSVGSESANGWCDKKSITYIWMCSYDVYSSIKYMQQLHFSKTHQKTSTVTLMNKNIRTHKANLPVSKSALSVFPFPSAQIYSSPRIIGQKKLRTSIQWRTKSALTSSMASAW
jgi:hypothetical protein